MKNLNKDQLKAITTTNYDSLRIIAGAGTGKTTVLVNRFKYLVENCDVPFNQILAVVFNTNAKFEIINRLSDFIPDPRLAWIHTYHSFCFAVLRWEYNILNLSKNFETITGSQKKTIIKKIIKNSSFAEKLAEIENIYTLIDEKIRKFKFENNLPHDLLIIKLDEQISKSKDKEIIFLKIIKEYISEQSKINSLDFDDYISYTHYLFSKYENVREKYESKFSYILMDEFQDIDITQYEIFKMIRKKNKKIFCVGDPDQCIYEWRNANPNIILNILEKDFSKLHTIALNENYRSYQFILNAANNVINNNQKRVKNIEKKLFTSKNNLGQVVYKKYNRASDEAIDVISQVSKLLNKGVNPTEIAILYRNNSLAGELEKNLKLRNIEYTILNNISFFDRLEVKVSISYLKLLFQDSSVQLNEILNKPTRGVGPVLLKKIYDLVEIKNTTLFDLLFHYLIKSNPVTFKIINSKIFNLIQTIKTFRCKYVNIQKNKDTIEEFINDYLKEVGLKEEYLNKISANEIEKEDRLNNLATLIQIITYNLLENNMSLLVDNNIVDLKDNSSLKGIIISTIHGVKGLEYEHVFIIGMADEIYSYSKNPKELEQDRRLIYVAFTRAKKELYLSYHTQIPPFLAWRYPSLCFKPSRFIKEAKIKSWSF